MVNKLTNKISIAYRSLGQYLGAALNAPKQAHAQCALFLFGACLLASGLSLEAVAQHQIEYNDRRLTDSVNVVLTYIEGSFGALVMVAAGIGAILSSAFRSVPCCFITTCGSNRCCLFFVRLLVRSLMTLISRLKLRKK